MTRLQAIITQLGITVDYKVTNLPTTETIFFLFSRHLLDFVL